MQAPIIITSINGGTVKKDGPNKGKPYCSVEYHFTQMHNEKRADGGYRRGYDVDSGIIMQDGNAPGAELNIGVPYMAEFSMQSNSTTGGRTVNSLRLDGILHEIKAEARPATGTPPR